MEKNSTSVGVGANIPFIFSHVRGFWWPSEDRERKLPPSLLRHHYFLDQSENNTNAYNFQNMQFAMNIFDRVLSSMTGWTCENVVGAEARHILQDVAPGLSQVDESESHRQTIGRSPARYVVASF